MLKQQCLFLLFHPNIAQVRPANPRVKLHACWLLFSKNVIWKCRGKPASQVVFSFCSERREDICPNPLITNISVTLHVLLLGLPSSQLPACLLSAALWMPGQDEARCYLSAINQGKGLDPASWIIGNIRKAISKAHGRRGFNEVRVTVAAARWWRRGRRRWGGSV